MHHVQKKQTNKNECIDMKGERTDRSTSKPQATQGPTTRPYCKQAVGPSPTPNFDLLNYDIKEKRTATGCHYI